MTVFRDNMFIQRMNVSFMALDSLKKNLTANIELCISLHPSPIMNDPLSHQFK